MVKLCINWYPLFVSISAVIGDKQEKAKVHQFCVVLVFKAHKKKISVNQYKLLFFFFFKKKELKSICSDAVFHVTPVLVLFAWQHSAPARSI